ncbi:MAG: DUF86 domain-containing protein [Actinobacteria bacterium]|nr:DUF86 domain-containing protein [Actinomycetota bacterium]
MSKRSDKEFTIDIKEASDRIESYIQSMKYKDFLNDTKTQDAVVRNIEIIGEAVKNLTQNFKLQHKDIDWKKIAGMRDKIIHFYFGVNLDVVWKTSKINIPELNKKVKNIISEIENYQNPQPDNSEI